MNAEQNNSVFHIQITHIVRLLSASSPRFLTITTEMYMDTTILSRATSLTFPFTPEITNIQKHKTIIFLTNILFENLIPLLQKMYN